MSRVRRTLRWTAIAVLTLGVTWGIYQSTRRLAEASPSMMATPQLLTLLTIAIIVLALGFVGILIRNLVRLIVDRKRGVLGARLRTKLVFFFLALVLLPAFVLSFGAGAFIRNTVEGLVHTPLEEIGRQAKQIVRESDRREEARLADHSRLLAAELYAVPAAAPPDARRVAAIHWRQSEGFDVAGYVLDPQHDVFDAGSAADLSGAALDVTHAAMRRAGLKALAAGGQVLEQQTLGARVLMLAAVPIDPKSAARGAAVVGLISHSNFPERLEQIDSADRAYDSFRASRRETLRLFYSIITLIGLTIVFVATWIGFYLSRRITVPLESIAAASREISAGNLGVRVLANVGDEVGQLVDAFNEMAGQLQESREVITRSTSELRRSNQALDERRRYIETLVAQLSTAVISVDRDGRVTTVNPAVGTMLKLRLALGDDLRTRLAESGLEVLSAWLDETAALGPRDQRRDFVVDRGTGVMTISVHTAPLRGTQGEGLGTLVMVEDLTDLLDAQRAAAWREVARRVAHEIKNPLTPIQLAAQRLRKKFGEGAQDLGAVVQDATTTIEREVTGLKALVDEFSMYARMPAPSPSPVNFGEIVRSVVALYDVHPGVRWDVRVDAGLGTVQVDSEQIRRALINLIDNAVAAIGGAGTIEVVARPSAGPGSLRIEVADTGPGVATSLREKIFAPYVSTKPKGTGLGLAIVHRIVVEHHGTIRAEDNVGGGARFVIEIPDARVNVASGAEG